MGNKNLKDLKGITVKREEDFGEWFSQVITKGNLIEYTDVSGCYILMPNAYAVWEKVVDFFDKEIKKLGVRNAYFPLLIPESYLQKEAKHIEGFAPEVAWVTEHGDTKMPERLAIRPTSETAMYGAYSKWIRSYNDLPLRLNQWCNIVRWEFKNPMPLLRGREFLWQEGHTAFATRKEATAETMIILDLYADIFEKLYAVPVLKGRKSEKEKFAGADYSLSLEILLPMGKAIQGCTSHHLGQNFSKAFEIDFTNEKGQKDYAWQNSWGITTRTIGIMAIVHGDEKGLVIPPKMAPLQAVVVPILFDKTKKKVLSESQKIFTELEGAGVSVHLDDREDYSPGWKFNEWEVKGVPVRIEIGPRDLEKKQVTLVRRDTGDKKAVALNKVQKEVANLLEEIQDNLFKNAEKILKNSIVKVKTFAEAKKAINGKKIVLAPWCGLPSCEEDFKERSGGAKSLNSPFKQPKISGKCFNCSKKAQYGFYFGKSY
tara:strand:+ start:254 stop:1711 length:1458 start_codon:yes stop_codon:yes gene_type:complete